MDITAIFIVGIVFFSVVTIIKTVFNHKHQPGMKGESEQLLNQELASLKDRVATLERIVTDEKYQLNKEFENLK